MAMKGRTGMGLAGYKGERLFQRVDEAQRHFWSHLIPIMVDGGLHVGPRPFARDDRQRCHTRSRNFWK